MAEIVEADQLDTDENLETGQDQENTPVHTGVMVAFYLEPEEAAKLALPEGSLGAGDQASAPEDLHITLAYFGDINNHPQQTKLTMLYNLKWFAECFRPVSGKVSGYALFDSPEGEPKPFVALFDSPGLESFRNTLKMNMQSEGIYPAANHGFTPHITLAYLADGTKLPDAQIPALDLDFESISLCWGEERYDFPLGTYLNDAQFEQYTVKASQANYGAKAGQAIVGKLTRGADGKFSSGGQSTPAGSMSGPKGKTPRKTAATDAAKAQAKADLAAAKEQDKQDAANEAAQKALENTGNTLDKLGVDSDIAEALTVGDSIGDISGVNEATKNKLRDAGIGQDYPDGTFDLTPNGRRLVKAAMKGDVKAAKRALATGKQVADKKAAVAARKKKKTKKEFGETPVLATTFKSFVDDKGQRRWLTMSSSGFQDKDKQFVTTRALTQDVARSYKEHPDKNFGPLRWWHVPGVDIGTCDFRGMSGSILIEFGTFKTKEIAEAIASYAAKNPLGVSIGFENFVFEPDETGAFNYITTKERSLLPEVRASNWLARFFNFTKKEKDMLPEKIQELYKAMGGSPEALAQVNEIVSLAAQTEKAALDAGLTVKEIQQPGAAEEEQYIGDMTHKEFQDQVGQAVKAQIAPFAAVMGNLTEALKGVSTTKEAQKTLTETIEKQAQTIKEMQGKLGELSAETPRAFNQYRASQQDTTVDTTKTEETVKSQAPAPDSYDAFLNGMFNFGPQTGQPAQPVK